jgi:MYXO-CTERM domain-containing protein
MERGGAGARGRFAIALLAALAAPRGARAAVVLESFAQDSARNRDLLEVLHFAVGQGTERLLIVGISIADPQVQATSVTWRGVPLQVLGARSHTAGGNDCRTELWTLADPASGLNVLRVQLSGSAPVGLGAVSYAGVDQRSATSARTWLVGANSDVVANVLAPDGRPVVAAACLGGPWIAGRGPGPRPASAAVNQAARGLWDFTEPGVVGIGSHRFATDGRARLRWDVTSTASFVWLAGVVSVTPSGESVPDGGLEDLPDGGATDQRPLEELPDAAADARSAPDDVGEPDAFAGEDTVVVARNVNLEVGCACRVGAGGGSPGGVLLLVGLVVLVGRRGGRQSAKGAKRSSRGAAPTA